MKSIRRLSLVIIASFVFAMGVFAAPPVSQDAQPNAASAKAKTVTVTTEKKTNVSDFADVNTLGVTEEAVELTGRSTYALSTCPPTFTPIANTIDRFPPITQPPIS